jgi:hypothetical protein
LKIALDIGFKAGIREVGESPCMVRVINRTLVQNQLKILHGTAQVKGPPDCHVFGKLCVARICVSSNLGVYEGLQLAFRQQKLMVETSITHKRQCAVLIVASMYNGSFQREGRVDTTNGWEGQYYEVSVWMYMDEENVTHQRVHLRDQVARPTTF